MAVMPEPAWKNAVKLRSVGALRQLSVSELSELDNSYGTKGFTVAHVAAIVGSCSVDILQCLHQLVPATLSAVDNEGRPVAHLAAIRGDVDALRCLFELVPATLSAVGNDGSTVANLAVTMGHVDALRCVFDLVPATLSAVNNRGWNAALHAAYSGHVDMLRCIHQLAPETLSAVTNLGKTVANLAAQQNKVDMLRCLHHLVPATLGAVGTNGATAAHTAAFSGHVDVLRCLFQLVPAMLSAVDGIGKTAEMLARSEGHVAAADYLDICSVWTPLVAAAADRLPERVTELLHSGADCTASIMYQERTLTALLIAQNLPQQFSWSLDVCSETVKLLRQAMHWSQHSHHLFPPRFRRGVRHILGLKLALEEKLEVPMLPNVVWHMIVAELPRDWSLDS